jgi:hypothetical protein
MQHPQGITLSKCRTLAVKVAAVLLGVSLCSAAWATDLQVRVTQSNGTPMPDAVVTVHALGSGVPAPVPL